MTKLRTVILLLSMALTFLNAPVPGAAAGAPPGKFYVVGTGPAGPELATLKAIDTMRNADLVLCSPQTAKTFRAYLQGKKVQDPWMELWSYQGKIWMKDLSTFPPAERSKIVAQKSRERDDFVKKMKVLLQQGKKIALLDGGDPTIFSRAYWLLEGLNPEQVEIIPGVGAYTAAMAALKKAGTGGGARFVLQTAPFSFFGKTDRDDLAQALARFPGTLVFYMGLAQIQDLVNTLKKYNPGDLPVAVVYYAGYPQKQKVVKGTLDNILAKIAPEKEKWLGMIIVGRAITGPNFILPKYNRG
ncbi:MAG: SAM-dependent methyltransferase [Thermodesulfobacteriota bacterium]